MNKTRLLWGRFPSGPQSTVNAPASWVPLSHTITLGTSAAFRDACDSSSLARIICRWNVALGALPAHWVFVCLRIATVMNESIVIWRPFELNVGPTVGRIERVSFRPIDRPTLREYKGHVRPFGPARQMKPQLTTNHTYGAARCKICN